jgi:sugar phosphate isomerase/epimerase
MADICAKMDASVMVVHPGYFSYPSDRQVALKAFGKSVPELENISRETGVKICIENMPMWECFLFREPGLNLGENAFALDVGHANTMGNLRDFLELDISHFHLHDNNGENDDHYHIGGGNIDYSMLENTLKNRIRAVKIIENKNEEDVMKSMAALKKMGVD